MKVLFLGNHTVGVRTLRAIRRQADLVGVAAHPDDPEDGVRYESVFAEARALGVPAIRTTGKAPELAEFVRRAAPDLLWIADFRYLLPREIVALARHGAINLHPSLLPAYRGRASINWAILRGETEFGLTAHVVDEGMDTGDIVGQRAYRLERTQDVGDALATLYPIYEDLTGEVLRDFQTQRLRRRAQPPSGATAFPRRRPEDGLIDWSKPAPEIWNLVRAVAAPYPGAFTPWAGGTLRIWKAGGEVPFAAGRRPEAGEVLESNEATGTLTVACGEAALVVTRVEREGTAEWPLAGDRLGVAPANAVEVSVPHNRLTHGVEEEAAVAAVVRSGRWAVGPETGRLEEEFAGAAGVAAAVAVGSGLAGLRLALRALDLPAEAPVAVPAYACVALANAALAAGARPVPVDVAADTWTMAPDALGAARARGRRFAATLAVHTFGAAAEVRALAGSGVPVIEDCSHAFGRGEFGRQGRLAVLSLHATKLMGAGEGGVILTDDTALAAWLRAERDYADRAPAAGRLNDKPTEMMAALARCQLRRLPAMLAARDGLAARYAELLAPLAERGGLRLPAMQAGRVWYRYAVLVPGEADAVVAAMAAEGVNAARPVEPWTEPGAGAGATAYRGLVSLPLYPTLTWAEQNRVVRALRRVLEKGGRA
jgi:methionyl-tRNA formyltransferase